MITLEVTTYTLDFKFSAKTSRGSMSERLVWFLQVSDNDGNTGLGEVAPIHRLSPEDLDDIPAVLNGLKKKLYKIEIPPTQEEAFDVWQS